LVVLLGRGFWAAGVGSGGGARGTMFGGLFSSFDKGKTKAQLRLAMNRLTLLQNKKRGQLDVYERKIRDLLVAGKREQAEVTAEHIIRERDESDAYELLQMQCDQLLARFQFVEREKELVEDVRELVLTIVWASPRISEVQELRFVREQFVSKYSKKVIESYLKVMLGGERDWGAGAGGRLGCACSARAHARVRLCTCTLRRTNTGQTRNAGCRWSMTTPSSRCAT